MSATVKRFVITHINRDGMRALASPQQGRYTYATREDAQKRLDAIIANTTVAMIKSVWGLPLQVRECECYAGHFDPVGIFFDDPDAPWQPAVNQCHCGNDKLIIYDECVSCSMARKGSGR